MHNFRSLSGRSLLHALVLASALLLAGGILSLIAPRMAVAQSAPAFTSDRLSVEVLGAGPDVILIPGYASSREVWRAEAERLSATRRVHMVQLAGFAGEPWGHGDGPFVQPVIDDLARYIDEAGLRDPAIIGHSMGGMSALMLAQQYPALVGKVMSVDSLPFFSALFGPEVTVETARPFAEQAAAGTLAADDASFRAGQVQGAVGYVNDPATQAAMVEWGMASDRQALATAIKEVMLTDLRPALPTMTTPVWAVYAADANGGAPPAMADALWQREYATLPGVELIRVDDTRHFIMADQPERFSEIVDRFLAE
ncbi:alpha/beta fold hydrolase [Brevundimonas halotolerans]|uniref:Pimeloyl-ACP methyl ester carboxylesterase n=1 Tax=Brevundimonas halotolerans TaxID=69670 RepID=A0A7W9A3B4_9CAUL|nr:alpha/beta hydrolase [Brevundimonas halotolerans]MBB5660558.1 pimeloyl-ACP methyl ester carboxylesterase [Brevundimonas halotolerans]